MRSTMLRMTLAGLALGMQIPFAQAVDVAEFARLHTSAPSEVPYRAIVTPGRIGGESLSLIVFLHGSGQNGRDHVHSASASFCDG